MPEYWQRTPPRQLGRHVQGIGRMGHFKKVCHSRRSTVVHEIEVETAQEYSEGEIKTVSIDSVHMNKDGALLTVELETHAGNNKIIVLYTIDTGSKGNIMPWHIFKRKKNKAIGCMTFSSHPTCQLGRMGVVYLYESLSGFQWAGQSMH